MTKQSYYLWSILLLCCCTETVISFSSSSSIPSGNRVLPVAVDTSSSTSVRWKVGPLFKRRRSSTNRQSQAQQETIDRDIAAEKTTHSVESSTIKALEQEEHNNKVNVSAIQEDIKAEVEENQQTPVETNLDSTFMQAALEMAQGTENTGGVSSPYPQPVVGAVLVATDGKILGKGRSDHNSEAVQNCIKDAGIEATALSEWCIAWPANPTLRNALKNATLYITLEPSPLRQGTAQPSITSLIRETGISRVVIGCCHPIHDLATKGAAALHAAGITVSMIGGELEQQCSQVLEEYAILQNNKLMCQARKHAQIFGRPLGFLHCSVVDSDNLEAFARHGNAFGTDFEGTNLGFRDFGSYEIAPPPEVVWVDTMEEEMENDSFIDVDFEDEYIDHLQGSPIMPWYSQCDAIVCTFPRKGNGQKEEETLVARLNGLKWLATHGEDLPAGVERILVMDATDLKDLPISNGNPNLPSYVDVEAFWKGLDRKPTRILLRRGVSMQARGAAKAAAMAAANAAAAAQAAAAAIESGDASKAAEAAIACQNSADASMQVVLKELQEIQSLKGKLEAFGVTVEMIEGGDPIDVMKHIGDRNGYTTVVWRAGCWGTHGSTAILEGAFQWISAHLAVDATGGKFWQLLLAENAIQGACGQPSKVKIFADQENLSLEYCDTPDADSDCTLLMAGRPVRHVRVDCRVALFDAERKRDFNRAKTTKMDQPTLGEQAPWFL